jgi:hypothetical protein
MSRRRISTLAILASVILAMAVVGRGSFLHGLAMVLIVAIALFILAVGGLIAWLGGVRPEVRGPSAAVITFGFAVGSLFLSMPIGWVINRRDVELAKAYCGGLRPELEWHRSQTGRYPERWPRDAEGGQLPRLLRGGEFYHSIGTAFAISFGDPSGMLNGFAYDSENGIWSEWD